MPRVRRSEAEKARRRKLRQAKQKQHNLYPGAWTVPQLLLMNFRFIEAMKREGHVPCR